MDTHDASPKSFGQALQVLSLVPKDLTKERLEALLRTGFFSDLLGADPAKLRSIDRYEYRKFIGVQELHEITVDYTRSLAQMTYFAKLYWRNSGAEAVFVGELQQMGWRRPQYASVRYEYRIFDSNDLPYVFTPNDALALISKANPKRRWHAAGPEQALAFSQHYPKVQTSRALLALGAHTTKERRAAQVTTENAWLTLHWGGPGNREPVADVMTPNYHNEDNELGWKRGFGLLAVREV